MLQIEYKNGVIEINTENKIYYISEIMEISLVYDLIECYRSESYDENTYRTYTMILNLISSAKTKLIRHQETQSLCTRKWW
jgi:hypothetical protein